MNYERIRPLGKGHFGEVFLERDLALDRLCATKVTPRPPGSPVRIDEAALLAATSNENVVRVFGAEHDDSFDYLRMEYVERGSIADCFGEEPMNVDRALELVSDACRGVQHLHDNGVLHRDIKPGNLLLGADDHVKLGDFGLATMISVPSPMPASYEPHLAPEEFRLTLPVGSVQADVYALGATGYRLLNGEAMFWESVRASPSVRLGTLRGQIPDRKRWQPHIHLPLRKVVLRALNPRPAARYRSALDLRHALEKVRPVVSWTMSREPARILWAGERNGDRTWEATLIAMQSGEFEFALRKRGPSGSYRRTSDRSVRDKLWSRFGFRYRGFRRCSLDRFLKGSDSDRLRNQLRVTKQIMSVPGSANAIRAREQVDDFHHAPFEHVFDIRVGGR